LDLLTEYRQPSAAFRDEPQTPSLDLPPAEYPAQKIFPHFSQLAASLEMPSLQAFSRVKLRFS